MKTDEFIERVVSLTSRIYPLVIRLLGNEEEAEDAVQDTMFKLWKISYLNHTGWEKILLKKRKCSGKEIGGPAFTR